MEATFNQARLETTVITIRVTGDKCSLLNSSYATISEDLRKIVDRLGIEQCEEMGEGFPVDICYYWWSIPKSNRTSPQTQRSERLIRFTENVEILSAPWLLNQERFVGSIPEGDETPHPLIHIPYSFVKSKKQLLDYFPRYAYIMDDSIWNYLLLQDQDIKQRFDSIIKHIIKTAFDDKYYYLNIAREYAHLKARIVREAFILNTGDKGNHGAHISPFLFHSESEMEHLNNELQDKVEMIKSHKWRFLLLDDKYQEDLAVLSTCKNKPHINKKQILENRLDNIVSKDNYILDCVANVVDAYNTLQAKKYDVVFIDYLLEDHHYGYELLSAIRKDCDASEKAKVKYPHYVGPGGRLFFMFTSAFTTAVSERLVLEGMNRSKDFWYIGEGACPTNTPQLFDYYLINILDKRIQDSGISDLSADEVYKLLFTIFKPKEGDEKLSVRKRANDNYQKVLSLQYHYHRLLKDVDENKGSMLVTHFITNHTHLGGLLEHLVQLVHITAFGSVRQWPEMWEEYLFCKAQFDDFFLGPETPINDATVTQELNRTIGLFYDKEKERYNYRVKLLDNPERTDKKKLELAKRTRLDTLYQYIEHHVLSLQSL